MLRLAWRLVRLTLLLAVAAVGVYFFHGPLFAPAGRYLVVTDPLEKSDWIVALTEAPYLTAPEAARLYHEGWAPAVLLGNAPRPRGQDELLRRGVPVKDAQETLRELLVALRVPAEAVKTVPERSADLRTALQAVGRFLAAHSGRSVIMVTSKVRSARTKRLCTAELGPTIRCASHPAAGDPYDPARWWTDRGDLAEVMAQYAGLATDLGRGLWTGAGAHSAPPPVTIR